MLSFIPQNGPGLTKTGNLFESCGFPMFPVFCPHDCGACASLGNRENGLGQDFRVQFLEAGAELGDPFRIFDGEVFGL